MQALAYRFLRLGVMAAEPLAHLLARSRLVVKILHVEGFERIQVQLLDHLCDSLAIVVNVRIRHAYQIAEDHTIGTNRDARSWRVNRLDFHTTILQGAET